MKRVHIHTMSFFPDCVSTAYQYNEIALRLYKGSTKQTFISG